jgi:hypothetical protein
MRNADGAWWMEGMPDEEEEGGAAALHGNEARAARQIGQPHSPRAHKPRDTPHRLKSRVVLHSPHLLIQRSAACN